MSIVYRPFNQALPTDVLIMYNGQMVGVSQADYNKYILANAPYTMEQEITSPTPEPSPTMVQSTPTNYVGGQLSGYVAPAPTPQPTVSEPTPSNYVGSMLTGYSETQTPEEKIIITPEEYAGFGQVPGGGEALEYLGLPTPDKIQNQSQEIKLSAADYQAFGQVPGGAEALEYYGLPNPADIQTPDLSLRDLDIAYGVLTSEELERLPRVETVFNTPEDYQAYLKSFQPANLGEISPGITPKEPTNINELYSYIGLKAGQISPTEQLLNLSEFYSIKAGESGKTADLWGWFGSSSLSIAAELGAGIFGSAETFIASIPGISAIPTNIAKVQPGILSASLGEALGGDLYAFSSTSYLNLGEIPKASEALQSMGLPSPKDYKGAGDIVLSQSQYRELSKQIGLEELSKAGLPTPKETQTAYLGWSYNIPVKVPKMFSSSEFEFLKEHPAYAVGELGGEIASMIGTGYAIGAGLQITGEAIAPTLRGSQTLRPLVTKMESFLGKIGATNEEYLGLRATSYSEKGMIANLEDTSKSLESLTTKIRVEAEPISKAEYEKLLGQQLKGISFNAKEEIAVTENIGKVEASYFLTGEKSLISEADFLQTAKTGMKETSIFKGGFQYEEQPLLSKTDFITGRIGKATDTAIEDIVGTAYKPVTGELDILKGYGKLPESEIVTGVKTITKTPEGYEITKQIIRDMNLAENYPSQLIDFSRKGIPKTFVSATEDLEKGTFGGFNPEEFTGGGFKPETSYKPSAGGVDISTISTPSTASELSQLERQATRFMESKYISVGTKTTAKTIPVTSASFGIEQIIKPTMRTKTKQETIIQIPKVDLESALEIPSITTKYKTDYITSMNKAISQQYLGTQTVRTVTKPKPLSRQILVPEELEIPIEIPKFVDMRIPSLGIKPKQMLIPIKVPSFETTPKQVPMTTPIYKTTPMPKFTTTEITTPLEIMKIPPSERFMTVPLIRIPLPTVPTRNLYGKLFDMPGGPGGFGRGGYFSPRRKGYREKKHEVELIPLK